MKVWNAHTARALAAAMFAAASHAALANSAIVYYKPATSWSSTNIHYGINGSWTTTPGVAMDAACTGWKTKTIELGTATSWQATFNNGSGTWDNNAGKNYTLGTGIVTVNGGVIGSTNPCASADTVAPSAPTGLMGSTVTPSSVTLSWTASTDNVGVVSYNIYRNGTKVASSTTTSYIDSGASGTTVYTVSAVDAAGNVSALSAGLSVVFPVNQANVYYKPATGWSSVYLHYGVNGTWTTTPGVVMSAACTGWYVRSVSLGSATSFAATFNNGSGTWDNNAGKNYTLTTGDISVSGGVVSAGKPCSGTADTEAPTVPTGLGTTATTTTSISLAWTPSTDTTAVTGYTVYRNGTKVGTSATASYTDSGLTAGTSYSYTLSAYDAAGNASAQSTALAASTQPGTVSTANVYYYTGTKGWSSVNIHYGISGTWTTPPGVAMTTACTNWVMKSVSLGTATSMKADFNNGSTWDNNGGTDYTIASGTTTVKDGVVTSNAAAPCVVDTTAPTVPGALTGTATNTTIALSWAASTDNVGVTGYTITRTGGSQGTVTLSTSGTAYTDGGLDAQTTYSYTVKAVDAAGNASAASTAASVKTGDAVVVPPPNPGEPLGTDMRGDSIYFVMTARFYDGDSTNNRGGSQHTKSGNAANNDPMFRGDFKGLIQKLDYIKALGFSAIWITPVVLNRSDYDYHGYHAWDFNKVDPRLESPGATYQDLINEAHKKGIKIIQDVVFNHSSRWGAKGLWTSTVYGVRDSQWSWYYDQPNAGFQYDGLTVEPVSGKSYYNGDLWSTAEPAGNTCKNWGVATGTYSAEGYKVYNCQWPNPTSGMFPAKYYHQCWIGNWEGEDSRSCWIHEDLADFNTENAEVQSFLNGVYNKYIDMGVDGFRIDTAVHIPRVTWNRRFLPQLQAHAASQFGDKGKNFFMFGEVGAFVNDKWNRGSVNHSAQFFTWKERKDYTADDVQAALDQYNYENTMGTSNQPTSTNAFLSGNAYHAPDHSQFSGMSVIDMRMHMNFGDASNAFWNGKDSDDSYNDATYNVVYVDSHDYGPNKSSTRYAGGTSAWAENMSLMWTFRGIPTLYYGSEIEFQAGKQIDCGATCPLANTGRAYYGNNIEGSVTASDFGVVASASGTVATTLQKPLVKHLQRLNQIRRKIPALQLGQYSTANVSGGIAYKRRYTDSSKGIDSFALVSISGGATFSNIPNGTYKDAVTGAVVTVTNGTLTTSVSGQGNARIFVLDLPGNPAPGKIGETGPFLY
ncbi:carbohydrate binding domain-containing protein [Niveibacterium sp.]|uniref:carbohydrate binding domain-containing protein n=1 Tax=Niveibacterium sp. TaxID=2017444 RepID=UPI0035AF7A33